MKRVFFASAAALATIVGLSAFKSHKLLPPKWFAANLVPPTGHGFIAKGTTYSAADFDQTELSAEPSLGISRGQCSVKSNFVCAAEFSVTTGGTQPVTYQSPNFQTGQYNY